MKGVSCQSCIQKGKTLNLEVETPQGNFGEKPRISWSAYLVLYQIGHFTVACSVTRPLNDSEIVGDLVLIQT